MLARADRLVAVTRPIAEDLAERLGRSVAVVTNGFDPDEFGDGLPDADGLLTPGATRSCTPAGRGVSGRSPRAFVDGLVELRRRWPDVAGRLDVVFAGPVTAEEQTLLADPRLEGMARTVGMLERPRALGLQRAADSLLVFAEGASSRSVATTKLFEYLAAGKPVLVLGADTEAARIVDEVGAGISAASDDPGAVAAALRRLVAGEVSRDGDAGLDRFAWPALTERFEAEIEAACARGGADPSVRAAAGANVLVVGPAEPANAVAEALARRGAQVRTVRVGEGRAALAPALMRAIRLTRRHPPARS